MAPTGGERVLSIRSELHHSGVVMVSVEDTGEGLEPGAVDRIFNPMFTTTLTCERPRCPLSTFKRDMLISRV
jgi:signal transduction histidine kinase